MFFEVVRIIKEYRDLGVIVEDLYMENVDNIIREGMFKVWGILVQTLADLGYVLRWIVLGANNVGAPTRRLRWFCWAKHCSVNVMSTLAIPISNQEIEERCKNTWSKWFPMPGPEIACMIHMLELI